MEPLYCMYLLVTPIQYVGDTYLLISLPYFEVLILCTVHYFYITSSPTVVLYNCGDLSGNDCSGCLGLSADYRCGYCQPNCILSSLTCGSSVIKAPSFQQRGAISVIEASEFMLFFLLSMACIIVNLSLSIDLPFCWSCCWKYSVHSQ